MTISLQGYIFFGSAVRILEDVKSHVLVSDTNNNNNNQFNFCVSNTSPAAGNHNPSNDHKNKSYNNKNKATDYKAIPFSKSNDNINNYNNNNNNSSTLSSSPTYSQMLSVYNYNLSGEQMQQHSRIWGATGDTEKGEEEGYIIVVIVIVTIIIL